MPELRRWIERRRGIARLGRESSTDLVQSVCREALEASSQFDDRGPAAFRGWLRQIADRKVAQRVRFWSSGSRETARTAALDDAGAIALPPDPSDPVAEVAADEDRARVTRAVDALPEPYRSVMRQTLEGATPGQIGDRLGRRAGVVRTIKWRALAMLGASLEAPEVGTEQVSGPERHRPMV
ncbi:MAG: RNA polymerase sigma factor [Planctomycetota bacterium]